MRDMNSTPYMNEYDCRRVLPRCRQRDGFQLLRITDDHTTSRMPGLLENDLDGAVVV